MCSVCYSRLGIISTGTMTVDTVALAVVGGVRVAQPHTVQTNTGVVCCIISSRVGHVGFCLGGVVKVHSS